MKRKSKATPKSLSYVPDESVRFIRRDDDIKFVSDRVLKNDTAPAKKPTGKATTRLDKVRVPIRKNKAPADLFDTIGVFEKLANEPKLARWAKRYLKAAEAAGEYLAIYDEDDANNSSVAGTIRLVCDIWPFVAWQQWLRWQHYGGPGKGGPWWILTFDSPAHWNGATLILDNDPWGLAFAEIYLATQDTCVQFTVRTPRNARLSKAKQNWFARAIMDGMRWHCDDDKFALVCCRRQRSLHVHIWDPVMLEHNDGGRYRKDADGILWHTGPW